MRIAFLAVFCLSILASTFSTAAFETTARAAYVVDLNTGLVLMDKRSDEPLPPASMSKLMTLNMLFEALRDGRVTLDTQFGVSDKSMAMGGSTMFLNTNDRPTVDELIKGIVVLSGNDACVAVAEGLAGTEEAFADQMNIRAKAIGLENSTFANASGWPHPNQRMSMKDLAVLAERLITEFPQFYTYFALTEFPYDNRAPQNRFNRNPLLKLGIGADGLKTGHTNEAGYGLVGSAKQGERRIIFVITGLGSEKERAEEAERVVNWAFRQFVQKTVVEPNQKIVEAPVWLGDKETVGLVTASGVETLIPALVQGDIPGQITYNAPFTAPISKGQVLGELLVTIPDMPEHRIELVADQDVGPAGFLPRLRTAASILLERIAGRAQNAL